MAYEIPMGDNKIPGLNTRAGPGCYGTMPKTKKPSKKPKLKKKTKK